MDSGHMGNRDITAAWTYHNRTKHTHQSVRSGARGLDWDNQPIPYKIYTTVEPILLPQEPLLPRTPALEAIAVPGSSANRSGGPASRVPDLGTLAGLLFLSAGITKRLRFPDGRTMPFRAAACTGALYHIELYLACGDLPGLPAGLYHFGVHDFSLRKLRSGDYRAIVAAATGREPAIAGAPVIIICTTTFWRNAWKYRERAYRHAFWDSGTLLANLLAAAAGFDLPARVVSGFVDADVNGLLDLDTRREVAVALVALGRDGEGDGAEWSGPTPPTAPLDFATEPLSKAEVDYPAIGTMHASSSLESGDQVRAWRNSSLQMAPPAPPEPTGHLLPLTPVPSDELPRDTIARVIIRRGSSRRFRREPITFAQLSTILDRATHGIPADFLDPTGGARALSDLYLIVHAVDGLPPGAYVFRRERQVLELLKEGNFRREAGYLGLEQALPADASVNVYLLADLERILGSFGNRGYRAAQLDAAITGGRLYLAAYALRAGATGLTFYDDDVTAFFSPSAAGKSVMFLVALGRPARRSRP